MIKYLNQPIRLTTNQNIIEVSNTISEKSPNILKKYYHSGRYHSEIEAVVDKAFDYTSSFIDQNTNKHKLAAIFDVDETMLSNADILSNNNFVNSPDIWAHTNGITTLPEIKAVKLLYDFLVNSGISIFIISARELSTYQTTKANLDHCGYHHYQKIFLKPDKDQSSFCNFKSQIRANISNQGYQIILNIGDKPTDFNGGHFNQGFLLPNHFY